MGLFMKLTHAAAGVDAATIAQCSTAEKNKYSILGTLVYIPLVTGVVAMAFACSYFTDSVLLTAVICAVWACLVFVIERALIAGLRPGKWSWAIPVRVLMAVAMSCIITELLLIFFFQADINRRIAEKNAVQTEQLYLSGNSQIEDLKADLARRKQLLDEKEKAYLDEIDGRNGTGIHGYGPSAKAKELALVQERADYEAAKIQLKKEIDAASARRDESVSELKDGQKPGLLQCIIALYELSETERNVKLALWIFHLFFLCVELMPLFIKLSNNGTQYYDILDLTDEQKLEALKQTMDETREMMTLASQCEIARQEITIEDEMTRLLFRQAADRALMEAEAISETARRLDELEARNRSRISDPRVAMLKKELEEIFERYLRNRIAEPATT